MNVDGTKQPLLPPQPKRGLLDRFKEALLKSPSDLTVEPPSGSSNRNQPPLPLTHSSASHMPLYPVPPDRDYEEKRPRGDSEHKHSRGSVSDLREALVDARFRNASLGDDEAGLGEPDSPRILPANASKEDLRAALFEEAREFLDRPRGAERRPVSMELWEALKEHVKGTREEANLEFLHAWAAYKNDPSLETAQQIYAKFLSPDGLSVLPFAKKGHSQVVRQALEDAEQTNDRTPVSTALARLQDAVASHVKDHVLQSFAEHLMGLKPWDAMGDQQWSLAAGKSYARPGARGVQPPEFWDDLEEFIEGKPEQDCFNFLSDWADYLAEEPDSLTWYSRGRDLYERYVAPGAPQQIGLPEGFAKYILEIIDTQPDNTSIALTSAADLCKRQIRDALPAFREWIQSRADASQREQLQGLIQDQEMKGAVRTVVRALVSLDGDPVSQRLAEFVCTLRDQRARFANICESAGSYLTPAEIDGAFRQALGAELSRLDAAQKAAATTVLHGARTSEAVETLAHVRRAGLLRRDVETQEAARAALADLKWLRVKLRPANPASQRISFEPINASPLAREVLRGYGLEVLPDGEVSLEWDRLPPDEWASRAGVEYDRPQQGERASPDLLADMKVFAASPGAARTELSAGVDFLVEFARFSQKPSVSDAKRLAAHFKPGSLNHVTIDADSRLRLQNAIDRKDLADIQSELGTIRESVRRKVRSYLSEFVTWKQQVSDDERAASAPAWRKRQVATALNGMSGDGQVSARDMAAHMGRIDTALSDRGVRASPSPLAGVLRGMDLPSIQRLANRLHLLPPQASEHVKALGIELVRELEARGELAILQTLANAPPAAQGNVQGVFSQLRTLARGLHPIMLQRALSRLSAEDRERAVAAISDRAGDVPVASAGERRRTTIALDA